MFYINKSNTYVCVIVFLLTLMNYGQIWFLMSVSLFLIFSYKKKVLFKASFLVLLFILFAYSLISIYFYYDLIRVEVYFYMFLYAVNTALGCSLLISEKKDSIKEGIRLYISIMIFVLLFQQVFYIVTKNYIDLHRLITFGEYESRYASVFLERWGLIRPTGIAIEPSNMGNIIVFLSVIYMLIDKKVTNRLLFFIAFSFLTFSFASIFTSALILLVLVISRIREKNSISLIILSTVIIVVCISFLFVFYLRFTSADAGYDAISTRLFITDILHHRDILNDILGNGILLFNDEIILYGYPIKIYNIQDSGFFVNMYFCFGIFGLVLMLLYLYFKLSLSKYFIVTCILLMTKFDYMQPLFWMLMYFVSSFNRKPLTVNKMYLSARD